MAILKKQTKDQHTVFMNRKEDTKTVTSLLILYFDTTIAKGFIIN